MSVDKKKYVAYYRVSTQQQGRSGLGLDAQRSTVERFALHDEIIAEYTDIESGKHSERPELLKAIDHANKSTATLLIAKLDRLSRDVEFIAKLMKSKVQFKCCDVPEADPFTIHIFAAMAQREREMISERTKVALKAAKERGIKLGGPHNTAEWCEHMRSLRKPKAIHPGISSTITRMHADGQPLHAIVSELTLHGYKTTRGNKITPVYVWRVLKRLKSNPFDPVPTI